MNDEDLRRQLDGLGTPGHRDGFWDELRHELDDTKLARLPTRRPTWVLAAAALVLVALVGVGLVVSRSGDDDPVDVIIGPDPSTTGVPDDASSTSTSAPDVDAPAGPLRPDGEPVERGPGTPIAVDPSGRTLYVVDRAPEGGQGCEGADRMALWAEPVEGGERQLVLPVDVLDATGRVDVWFGDRGQVVARALCEGFGNELVVADVAEDGTFAVRDTLTIPDLDLGRSVDAVVDVAWRTADELVATTWTTTEDGSEHRHLYSFPPAPSEATDLGIDGAVQVEVGADGQLVTLHADGAVRIDGALVIDPGAEGYAVDLALDDTGRLAAATPNVWTPAEGHHDDRGIEALQVAWYGADLLVGTFEGEHLVVRDFDLATGERGESLGVAPPGARFVVSRVTSRIFFTGVEAELPVVVEQRLTR